MKNVIVTKKKNTKSRIKFIFDAGSSVCNPTAKNIDF